MQYRQVVVTVCGLPDVEVIESRHRQRIDATTHGELSHRRRRVSDDLQPTTGAWTGQAHPGRADPRRQGT